MYILILSGSPRKGGKILCGGGEHASPASQYDAVYITNCVTLFKIL